LFLLLWANDYWYVSYPGKVILKKSTQTIDFLNSAHLKILPTHQMYPGKDDKKMYGVDLEDLANKQHFLTKTRVAFMSYEQCHYWDTTSDNHAYITFQQPYSCHCDEENEGQGSYCVYDPYPRKIMGDELDSIVKEIPAQDIENYTAIEPATEVSRVELSDGSFAVVERQSDLFYGDPDLGNHQLNDISYYDVSCTEPLSLAMKNHDFGMGSESGVWLDDIDILELSGLKNTIKTFGCNGHTINMLPTTTETINQQTYEQRVASAFALSLDVSHHQHNIKIELEPNPLDFLLVKFNFATSASRTVEKWLKSILGDFWGNLISWIVKWFLEIVEFLVNMTLTVTATVTNAANSFVTPNLFEFTFNEFNMNVEALVTHNSVATLDDPLKNKVQVGIRRINSSILSTDQVKADIVWQSPQCKQLLGPDDLLSWAKALITCPTELVTNISKEVGDPFNAFAASLVDAVLDISGAINGILRETVVTEITKLEKDNLLAALITDTITDFNNKPFLWNNDVNGGNSAPVPPPAWGLSLFCASGSAAASSSPYCTIANLFSGDIFNNTNNSCISMKLERLGAKTHYRSLGDIQLNEDEYETHPPVRYCVGDVTQKDAPDYSTKDLVELFDFKEIESSEVNSKKPSDWRAQCAMYGEFSFANKLSGTYKDDAGNFIDYALKILPTHRTEFLVNEVFVCKGSDDCALGENKPISMRAHVASCSMLSDMWYHTNVQGEWRNLLLDMDNNKFLARPLFHLIIDETDVPVSEKMEELMDDMLFSCRETLEDLNWTLNSDYPFPDEDPQSLMCNSFSEIRVKTMVNGQQDNGIVIPNNEKVHLKISLDPGDFAGQLADLWVYLDVPFGPRVSFTQTGWHQGEHLTAQLELAPFGVPLYDSFLPAGSYQLFFSVDENANGIRDDSVLSSVRFTVVEP